jgi:hypothetical protein
MNLETLQRAIVEAKRFIIKADEAMERLRADRHICCGSKQTAAAKRASMDLTRALTEVRR